MDVEVANNTFVTLCTKLSKKIGVVISNQTLDQRLKDKELRQSKKLLHLSRCISSFIWPKNDSCGALSQQLPLQDINGPFK